MSQANTTNTKTVRTPDYTIYKPNRKGEGGAITFSFNRQKQAVFIEASRQKGEKQFDWENKIIMKWGLSDLGTMLAGIEFQKPNTKLFHQTDQASSACSLNCRAEAGEPTSFYLTVSRQDLITKEVKKVGIPISDSEAVILETALRTAIGRILSW